MTRPVIILLLASILWGISWLPLKYLNAQGFDGPLLIFMTFGCLSLFLGPICLHQFKAWRNQIKPLILIAILGGLANLCFTYSLIYGDVVRVMVLFYLLPMWGVLGGRFLLKETIDLTRGVAVILAISGAFIILGGANILESPPTWIDLIALLSGFFYAMNNIGFRAVQSVPVATKVNAMFIGCFTFAGLLLLFTVSSSDTEIAPGFLPWLLVLAYAFFWLLPANFGSQWAVTHMEAGRSSIIIIMELIAAVVSATILLDKNLSPGEWTGGFMILTAAILEATREIKSDTKRVKA